MALVMLALQVEPRRLCGYTLSKQRSRKAFHNGRVVVCSRLLRTTQLRTQCGKVSVRVWPSIWEPRLEDSRRNWPLPQSWKRRTR